MAELQEQEQNQETKNIFPLHLLKVSENMQVMVELKSGETYNGILKGVDKFMNIKLQNAYLTDPKAEIFRKVGQVYVRGNVLKYFYLDNSVLKKLQGTEYKAPQKFNKTHNKFDRKRGNPLDSKKG